MNTLNTKDMTIIQDMNKAISVMHNAGQWLLDNGKEPHDYFHPDNMNSDYLLKYVKPSEFYVAIVNGKPAASLVLQEDERNQSWESVDKGNTKQALYIHWLAVHRDFAGKGLSQVMINFAVKEAKLRGFKIIRLDTDANESKLVKLYENLGFKHVHTEHEEDIDTAFFQMNI